MAYKVIILYQLYMPSYFLGTFTEYPYYKLVYPGFQFYLSSIKSRNCSQSARVILVSILP